MPRLKARQPFAARRKQLIAVDDMTGGVDIRRSPTQIAPNRSAKLINWSISEPGALKVRKGYLKYSTTSLGAKRPTGGRRVYLSSGTFTLLAYEGQIYDGSSQTGHSTVHSTISTGNQTYFPNDRDMVAVFDSTNTPFKSTNGSSWTRFGIAPSSTNSTLAASTGDLLAKEFEVGFTYENSITSHESNGGKVSTITLGTTGGIRVEVTGSTDPQVNKVNFYARNKTDGESVRRKASSAANADGSTLSVIINSSAWTANAEEPQDNTVPEVMAFGVVWKNRWWGVDANVRNRLRFTQVFQAQSWPATFFIDIPFEQGDDIRAMATQGDTLILFGATKIFVVLGQTSLDFEVRPALDSQDGALGPRAVAVIENGVLHAGASGVYIFDGVSDRLLSQDIEPGWQDLIKNVATAELEKVACVYHSLEHEVRIAVPRLFPTDAAGEWVLDLNRTRVDQVPAWAQTDRAIGGYIHWNGAEDDAGTRGRLQSWSDTNGLIFNESTGTTANSSDMTAEYSGPTFTAGLHKIRVIDTHGEFKPAGGTFTIETEVDELSVGSKTITIGQGLEVYGSTAKYGTAAYGGKGRLKYFRMMPVGAEGRTFREKTRYVGKQEFQQFGYSYDILPETRIREFSE